MVKKYKKNSSHLFSERPPGLERNLVFISIVLLALFTLCSTYTLVLAPTNPIAWSMLVFFLILLLMVLFSENNVMPKMEKKKTPHAAVAWFFSWVFIAMLVSFLNSMNAAHLAMAIIFGSVAFIGFSYVILPQEKWVAAKKTVRQNTAGKISSKLKTKKRKKPKRKVKKRIHRW